MAQAVVRAIRAGRRSVDLPGSPPQLGRAPAATVELHGDRLGRAAGRHDRGAPLRGPPPDCRHTMLHSATRSPTGQARDVQPGPGARPTRRPPGRRRERRRTRRPAATARPLRVARTRRPGVGDAHRQRTAMTPGAQVRRRGARSRRGPRSRCARRRRVSRPGRVHVDPDARGCAGEDELPGHERARVGDDEMSLSMPKMRSDVELSWRRSPLTQVRRRRFSASSISSGVVIHGPQAAVGALAAHPLRLAALQVARADVVGHRVPRDLVVGAHDDRQLSLVVELLRHRRLLTAGAARSPRAASRRRSASPAARPPPRLCRCGPCSSGRWPGSPVARGPARHATLASG